MGFFDKVKKALESEKREDIESQNSDENIANDEIDSIEIFENDDACAKIKNFKYLDDLIHSGVKEIVLDSDIILSDDEESEYKNGIKLDVDDLVIDGNNHTIDANEKTRIFFVFDHITLKNITFKNGSAENGAAIFNSELCSLRMESCSFEGNSGGAIFNDHWGSLRLESCSFKDNSSRFIGCAIHNYDGGSLRLESCSFEGNTNGAIYNNQGEFFDLMSCSFKDNIGIDVYNNSLCNIFKSNFVKNLSEGHIIIQEAPDSSLTIENTTFSSNTNIVNIKKGFVSIVNCKFNLSENIGEYAVYNEDGELTIIKLKYDSYLSIFNDNIIKTDEKQLKNFINQGHHAKPIKPINPELQKDYKGFTYLDEKIQESDRILLDRDIVIHDLEQKFYEGGIELDKDNLIIDGLKEDNTKSVIDGKNLSRIFLVTGKNIKIKNIIFKNGKHFKNHNSSNFGGGAIYVMPNASITIENCEFIENNSRQKGGAIYNKSNNLSIINSKFIKNETIGSGGAIYNRYKCSLSLISCSFEDNSSRWGGAISNEDLCSLSLESCNFERNSSKEEGGAISNSYGCSLSLNFCNFESNSSQWGGAISNWRGSWSLVSCNFEGNSSKENGGAISNNRGSLSLESCNFEHNTSIWGGAISNYNFCPLSLESCSFESNSSKKYGGAIYLYNAIESYESENCTFKDNKPDDVFSYKEKY